VTSAGFLLAALLAGAEPQPATAAPPADRAAGEAFEVALVAPPAVRAGARGTARVVLSARGPYHVNRDYPASFRPGAASTAIFPGARVALGDGAERTPCRDFPGEACTVSLPLPFTAAASGETRIAGVVAFSVCNPDRCLIEKVPLAVSVRAP
jgi:hypothetical protein